METLGRIRTRGDDDFAANDFDSMPYLIAFGKVVQARSIMLVQKLTVAIHSPQEVLRVYPIAVEILRVSKRDHVLPLSKPIVGVSGKIYKELSVPAGTFTKISTLGYNL